MQRLALFSSFISNSQTAIPRYIFYYLQQIRPHVKTLVFIYNDDFDINASRDELLTIVDDIMPVKNEGYDFGMWQKGLQKHKAEDYDELCLVNDSCVCIGDLNYFFNQFHTNNSADITGFSLCKELGSHLQSYFLCIKKTALPVVTSWIRKQNFAILDWVEIVVAGELGLSAVAMFQNLSLGAMVIPNDNFNPLLHHAEQMIRLNVPLVKKKTLLINAETMFKEFAIDPATEEVNTPIPFLTETVQQERHLSLEQCHLLFEWMPHYVLEQRIYQGKSC